MRKIVTLLTFSILAMAAMAVEITFDPTVDLGDFTGTTARAYKVPKDGITFEVSNGLINGHYRIYKGQTATFTSSIGNISKIVFECTAADNNQYGPGNFTWDVGEYRYLDKTGTWEGNNTRIVFTASGAQVRCTKITVTVEEAGLVAPSITPAGGTYYSPIEVSMSCITPDAKIYYTTNGSNPTAASQLYTQPFTVDHDMTVKAISALNGELSGVTTAQYTFAELGNFGWGDMKNTPDGETVVFAHDAIVIGQVGRYLYAMDETGAGLAFGDLDQSYVSGDVIPAGYSGTKTTYNTEPELAAPLAGFLPKKANVDIFNEDYAHVRIPSEVSHDTWGEFVLFKNVYIDVENSLIIDADGNSCPLYNARFNIALPTDGKAHDLFGVIDAYGRENPVYQLLPIKVVMTIDTVEVRNIPELYDLPEANPGIFTTPLTTIYQNGINLYVKDIDGNYSLAYGSVAYNDFANGDFINNAVAMWSIYQDFKQLVPGADTFIKAGHGTPVEPEIMPIEEVSQDMIHWYLGFENISIIREGDDLFAEDETGRIKLYDKFKIITEDMDLDAVEYVEGFLTIYRGELELYPISFGDEDPGCGKKGDVNNDGEITVGDINALIDIILTGKSVDTCTFWRADVAEDNELGIADINALISGILSGSM